ncbi:MAG: YraN family protein [Patescibacteria group bacterium]|nr:YraN family protein [Patescibacteria group bacterium]
MDALNLKVNQPKTSKKQVGHSGENIAAEWLASYGFHILEKNFRVKQGEVDLIVRHNNRIHFIEIKARTSGFGGLPEDFVNSRKQSRLIKAAYFWLAKHQRIKDEICFSIVAVRFRGTEPPDIRFIENAFEDKRR